MKGNRKSLYLFIRWNPMLGDGILLRHCYSLNQHIGKPAVAALLVSKIKLFHFKITFFTDKFYFRKCLWYVIPSSFSLPYKFTITAPGLKIIIIQKFHILEGVKSFLKPTLATWLWCWQTKALLRYSCDPHSTYLSLIFWAVSWLIIPVLVPIHIIFILKLILQNFQFFNTGFSKIIVV